MFQMSNQLPDAVIQTFLWPSREGLFNVRHDSFIINVTVLDLFHIWM
jgi:hypothetical protein